MRAVLSEEKQFRVEVPISDGSALSGLMSKMREWLDHHRVEAAFDCDHELCRVDFASAEQANEFAAAFGGTVLAIRSMPAGISNVSL